MMKNNEQRELLSKALSAYTKYKGDKEVLNRRVRENDYWYKARYQRLINPTTNESEPATGFIFSAIENKFADAVDNFPAPNILGREPGDEKISDILTKILPVQLELSNFKKAYKANWRRKLKHGTGIYGVFYADGEIVIKPLSVLNVYCDMHVGDVQDSQFLFIVNAVDNDELKEKYPEHKDKFTGNASVENFTGTEELEDRTEVIDCYYKKHGQVHCMKLCGNEIIASTEGGKYPDGIYKHGMYPVVFDVMYPEEDCPFGFGVIDIAKNPQLYIDRLDGAIAKNAVLASKIRFLIKDSGSVNEDELLDCDNDVVHVAGSVDTDSIRELQISGLPEFVTRHRDSKIDELKEIVGNRDFQQGGTNNGVTAASAISILQEAGNKLSRSAIDDAYDCYKDVVRIVIELMREFFNEKKIYRITGENGTEYAKLSSDMMYKDSGVAAEATDNMYGLMPDEWKGNEPIEFDIEIVPQKQNPFQREANNTTIMELWSAGFFNPQAVDMSVVALQAMNFDGRDKIIESLQKLKQQTVPQEQMNMPAVAEEDTDHAGRDQLVPVEQGIQQILEAEQAADEELVPVEDTIAELRERESEYGL